MALNAAVVWEVQTGGSDNNGGGFKTGASGTDRSQQTAAHVVIDGVTITCTVNATTTKLDIAGYTTVAADIGNIVQITGGTMTAGFYEITAQTGGTQWTVDRAAGTAAQTGTGNMGGCLATPGKAGGAATVAGHKGYIKSGTYSITSATINIAGGCLSPNVRSTWIGYETTRDDYGARPLLQASGIATAYLVESRNNDVVFANLSVDGASLTSIRGFTNLSGGRVVFYKCKAVNCTNSGFSSVGIAILCEATGCSTTGAGFSTPSYGCVAYGNSVPGFSGADNARFFFCISYANTTSSGHGFVVGNNTWSINCVAYGNGGWGFSNQTGSSVIQYINCLSEGNAGYGYDSAESGCLYKCGGYNNTSGAISGTPVLNVGFVTATGTFFTNAAAGNFSLNNTAGNGAAARAAGLLGVFPVSLTTGYIDIGAVQHADPAGAAGAGGMMIGNAVRRAGNM